MLNRLREFVKSILAGLMISIGGIVFLSTSDKTVGAFLFSCGLVSVVAFGFNLYTGRIGYVLENNKIFFIDTVFSVFGNFLGCVLAGLVKSPIGNVVTVVQNKLNKDLLTVFTDAVFCGILIFVCVDIYKKKNTMLGILLCIPTFILCGFEHSVADMFYIINARLLNGYSLLFILIVILGNAAGGLIIPVCQKFYLKTKN